MLWRMYAFRGYLLLQRLDEHVLEPLLPPAIFYNLLLSARRTGVAEVRSPQRGDWWTPARTQDPWCSSATRGSEDKAWRARGPERRCGRGPSPGAAEGARTLLWPTGVADFPLFPLGVVALPGEAIPLHIFEERYKTMMDECLREEREFGIVWLSDDGLRESGAPAGSSACSSASRTGA